MSDVATVFAILGGTIALFVWNRLPAIVVAMASALALYASGILTLPESLAGFGDPVVAFVAALFVVTAGLEATGVTAWAGQVFERAVAGSRTRLQVVGMLAVAALCPLINASGAVGALLPVMLLLVVRLGDSPARVLMPMAFAAGAGSHLALTGAPKNVLIADAVAYSGAGALNFFEFALVGLPLLAGTVLLVTLLGDRLTPKRAPENLPPDLSRFGETMVDQYRLAQDVFRLRVSRNSPLVGMTVDGAARSAGAGLELLTATARDGAPRFAAPLEARDALLVRGTGAAVQDFADANGLRLEEVSGEAAAEQLINRMTGVTEVVIPPRSPFIGREVFAGMLPATGDLVVLAIQRRGEALTGTVALEAGDHLLVQGGWDALDRRRSTPGVLVVDNPGEVKRQLVVLGAGARTMIAIAGAMVAAIASGLAAPAFAALVAAGAVLALGIVSPERAYREINWTTVILMAGMFPLSTALTATGAADLIAGRLVALTGSGEPRLLLGGIFVLGVALGVVISNTATCLILIPIVVVSAGAYGISPLPALMTLSVATSASFLTPVSTPVNTMVMGPAGYRFGDYWRLGLPLTLIYGAVAVWLVPLIWPL